MSKRSSRRKRKEQARKQAARQTGPVLTQQGKTAFSQANYSGAIEAWEQARNKPDAAPGLAAALAEAYFRQAVTNPSPSLADLQQAVELAATDSHYRYHLAVTYHGHNQAEQAESLYRQLLAESPPFRRAALPLAQVVVEKGKDVTADPVWSHLSEEEQEALSAILALSQNQPAAALLHLPSGQANCLWRGLAAFALAETATASQEFEKVLDLPDLHPLPRSVARYYLGVLAAQAGQTEPALAHWQAARNDGLDTPQLRRNLAILFYQQALAEQQAGHPSQALELLDRTPGLNGHNDSPNLDLDGFRQQLNLEAGYADAQQGDWPNALRHWQAAQEAGDSSRRLVINLALANEQLGQFGQAAELWREALRRRPRSADHPDALNDDQVARLWQHVAESYSKADNYEQAITTYRNAVKWSPDNIDLRLHLVDILQAEGRWQAADNELERILEKKPDHIPALTRQAESYESEGYLEGARRIWQRVLETEPQHPVARQQLAHLFAREGVNYIMWGWPDKALAIFQEGIRQVPDDPILHAYLGSVYSDLDDFDQTRHYFEQALALDPDNLATIHHIFLSWINHDQLDEAQQILERIKAFESPAPAGFLLELVDGYDRADLGDRAWKLLEFIEHLYPDEPEVLLAIADRLVIDEQEARAAGYLRRILRHNANHAEANLRLGTIYYSMGQTRLAKNHWKTAEQQARKENDMALLAELEITKNALMHGIVPPAGRLAGLLGNMPPELSGFLDELKNYKK
ncbi:MAG TPA: tetratricopeptide repeat protein [Anaerolineae bacterium]